MEITRSSIALAYGAENNKCLDSSDSGGSLNELIGKLTKSSQNSKREI